MMKWLDISYTFFIFLCLFCVFILSSAFKFFSYLSTYSEYYKFTATHIRNRSNEIVNLNHVVDLAGNPTQISKCKTWQSCQTAHGRDFFYTRALEDSVSRVSSGQLVLIGLKTHHIAETAQTEEREKSKWKHTHTHIYGVQARKPRNGTNHFLAQTQLG